MNIMPSVEKLNQKLLPTPILKDLQAYQESLSVINGLAAEIAACSDSDLREWSARLSGLALAGPLDPVHICKAFALVREVSHRVLGMRPYDVQVLAGLVLNDGKLAEMKTGEGKTLAAVAPAYVNALSGKGVHILTFNDYLARRDAEWMGPVFQFLGLSVGYIDEKMSPAERKRAYQCDITYATAKEVGFDFLRGFIAYDPSDTVTRPFHFAIVDEADALLIDAARNPLVLAGTFPGEAPDLFKIDSLVKSLTPGEHYFQDEYGRNVYLSESGIAFLEESMKISNLHADAHFIMLSAINQSLHAHALIHRDVDYVVKDGKIKLVDASTGRIVEDRKWQNGLQMAVEAKEGLEIQSQGSILGSISLQHFVQNYPRLSAMTATAVEAAEEFEGFYGLQTVVIPPNVTSIRKDLPDRIFARISDKRAALVAEVAELHATGRPILIGTLTVRESEMIAEELKASGVSCEVLNAKNDEKEAEIIARAGLPGAVTISTNMAGRGTDIALGGKDQGHRERVVALGGLHVIGTNRHESKRIDNQLRGRAGRQGDPGSTQFFISLEDRLMVTYRLRELLPRKYRKPGITGELKKPVVLRRIDQAQRIMEGQTYDIRRTLVEYNGFVERQRRIFQEDRQLILNGTYEAIQGKTLSDATEEKVRDFVLSRFDQLWSGHLNYALALREGIHLVRIGGEEPLRVFHQKVADHFDRIQVEIQEIMYKALNLYTPVSEMETARPSSTWTYVINDNPFKDSLGMMLLGGGNMGFQVDFFSLPILMAIGIGKRIGRAFRKQEPKK